ncbi:MAG: DUF3299 domain-containing protein [Planctomycetota bacterium]
MPRISQIALAFVLVAVQPLAAQQKDKAPPPLPTKDSDGAWVVSFKLLAETRLPSGKSAVFHPELKKLVGQKVRVTGFVQPFEDAADMWSFMVIQYPVGCWYCEAPGPTTIVLVEMPENKELNSNLTSDAVTVTGKLELNEKDPEDFLYIVVEAAAERAKVRPYVPPAPDRPKPVHTRVHP